MERDEETKEVAPVEADSDVAEGAASKESLSGELASEPTVDAREAAPKANVVEPPPTPWNVPTWIAPLVAVVVPFLLLFVLPPLSKSGLWDPYELTVADLSRRIALHLHGAQSLSLAGAENGLPFLNDLGRPQLPFTSIALGFAFFGLHEWAGRLPLACWGFLGAVFTYAWVARMIDRRAGVYAAVSLVAMPLYFVQSRTMLGEIVTMSAVSLAFGGLVVAVFDLGATRARVVYGLIGLVGLAAGYGSRGMLLGVAAPCLGVGIAWGVARASSARRVDMASDVLGSFGIALGVLAIWKCYAAMSLEKGTSVDMWVGAIVRPPGKYPTFDVYLGHLGHSLAPWSAFLPFALGRLFIAPKRKPVDASAAADPRGDGFERESLVRVALLVGTAVIFGCHAFLSARTDFIAFTGPALLAAACGIALSDFERGAHPSLAVGVGTAVFLGLFHHDYHETQEKAFQAYSVTGATFPESFRVPGFTYWNVVLLAFAAVAVVTWLERDDERTPFAPARYAKLLRDLQNAWDGLLSLAYFALVAGASLAGLIVWVGLRTKAKWLPAVTGNLRESVLSAWWVTAFVPLAVIFGTAFGADVWLWAFGRARPLSSGSVLRGFEPFEDLAKSLKTATGDEKLAARFILTPLLVLAIPAGVFGYLYTHGAKVYVALLLGVPAGFFVFWVLGFVGDLLRGSRAAFFCATGVALSAVLCLAYYPALANQLSPKEVFESYQKVKKPDEPLALLGVGSKTAAYYAGGQPTSFNDGERALEWLGKGAAEGPRRYVAVNASELAKLNFLYRRGSEPARNLPVLDAQSSQILLVASRLEANEKNKSPLGKVVFSEAPKPQRRVEANFEDKLEFLGVDVFDPALNRNVDAVSARKKYRLRSYFKVLAPITTEYESFVHIDGQRRRHNGDHKPLEGKYPFRYWLPGDYVMDDYEMQLDANFTTGNYTIYFGFFVGETRFKIKSGPNDGADRVIAGTLKVL